MKRSSFLRIGIVLTAAALIAGAFTAKSFLTRFANSDEFKRFAEQKAGEYFKAKVSIGEIRPYGFDKVALERIIIEAPSVKGGSQLIRLDRLIFRYRLDQLWNRKFDNPAGVVLKNPSILIEQDQFPYRYFGGTNDRSSGFGIPSLDFKGGEIRYRLASLGKDILLTDIDGRISPAADLKVQIDIQARATGFLEGKVAVRGLVDPVKNTHDLWLELKQMNFSRDIPLPFQAISGKVRWTGRDLFFEGVQATLHGWEAELSGSFENAGGQPRTALHVRVGKEKTWVRTDLSLNLNEQKMDGSVQIAGQPPAVFAGSVRTEGKRFIADSLTINDAYQGKGELDFSTGNYEITIGKDAKRVSVYSNMRGLDLAIHGNLDHFRVFGLDLVTQGRIYLHALSTYWQGRQFRFKGDFETDYFILNQQPFHELKGSFDLSPYGVTDIRCDWGRKFQATGQVVFARKKPQAKLTVRVAGFDLGEVQFFAAKPLSKELGGKLDGKLVIEGDLGRPEFAGEFSVHDGKWGKVDYDRGVFQFRGFLPYWPLQDSKIWKGRSVFNLSGAVDFRLENILAGVKIDTPDSLIVWKGLEVSTHRKEKSLELKSKQLQKHGVFSTLDVDSLKKEDAETGNSENDQPSEQGFRIGTGMKF